MPLEGPIIYPLGAREVSGCLKQPCCAHAGGRQGAGAGGGYQGPDQGHLLCGDRGL